MGVRARKAAQVEPSPAFRATRIRNVQVPRRIQKRIQKRDQDWRRTTSPAGPNGKIAVALRDNCAFNRMENPANPSGIVFMLTNIS